MTPKGYKQTSIILPDHLHEAWILASMRQNQTMRDWLTDLLTKTLTPPKGAP